MAMPPMRCDVTMAGFNNMVTTHPKMMAMGVFVAFLGVFVALPTLVAMMAMRGMH